MSVSTAVHRVHYEGFSAHSASAGLKPISKTNSGQRPISSGQTTGIMPNYGGGAEKCARCSQSVYLAEKKVGAGRSFHTRCFSCQTCNRKLDASTLSEHKGEIYCKTCYTRQFGVHGLVSGVTMSTEHPVQEVRHSRRSSYGSDLDAPVITHQQTRQRAHSNDNLLRGELDPIQHDELPKMFPWRNDVIPNPPVLPSKTNNSVELDRLIEKTSQPRPASQIGFERMIGTTFHQENTDRHQSTLFDDNDRQKYISPGEKLPYGQGAAAVIGMPVVSPPKPVDSRIDRIEIPLAPTKSVDHSPSPLSPTTSNPYVRSNSREPHTDISDNFSRLTLGERQSETLNRKHSTDTTTNIIASENPLIKPTYSNSSSYETSHFAVTSNTNNTLTHEKSRSRESSPSSTSPNQRTSSSTSGYASNSVHNDSNPRNSASPSAAFVGQHDYLNINKSPSTTDTMVNRRSSSPQSNERTPSAINEFVSKTKPVATGHFSPTNGGKYSTLAALVQPHRPLSQHNYSDDDFEN